MANKPAWYASKDKFGQPRDNNNPANAGNNIERFPPRRFWMDHPQRKEVVIIDSPVDNAPIYEYSFPMNGEWKKCEYLTADESKNPQDCLLQQRFGRDYRWQIIYSTIVDVQGYRDAKGNQVTCELRLFGVKSQEYAQYTMDTAADGPLNNICVTLQRASKDDPRTGVLKARKKAVDPEALFPHCRYSGKLLSEWWAMAEANPTVMAALQRVFAVEFDRSGKLLRKVVPFNYDYILAPKSDEEIQEIFANGAPMGKKATAAAASAKTKAATPAPAASADLQSIFGADLFPPNAPQKALPSASPIDDIDDSHIPF